MLRLTFAPDFVGLFREGIMELLFLASILASIKAISGCFLGGDLVGDFCCYFLEGVKWLSLTSFLSREEELAIVLSLCLF